VADVPAHVAVLAKIVVYLEDQIEARVAVGSVSENPNIKRIVAEWGIHFRGR